MVSQAGITGCEKIVENLLFADIGYHSIPNQCTCPLSCSY
uniref:Uncharacterized protein n=1 Tax=Triticum urartu TaxID=4572 RepID=A0A8R7UXW1_TRIUA